MGQKDKNKKKKPVCAAAATSASALYECLYVCIREGVFMLSAYVEVSSECVCVCVFALTASQ